MPCGMCEFQGRAGFAPLLCLGGGPAGLAAPARPAAPLPLWARACLACRVRRHPGSASHRPCAKTRPAAARAPTVARHTTQDETKNQRHVYLRHDPADSATRHTTHVSRPHRSPHRTDGDDTHTRSSLGAPRVPHFSSCARAPARPVQCSRDENVRAAVLLASGRASARPPICRSAPPPVCEGRHPFDRLSASCRLRQQNFHR